MKTRTVCPGPRHEATLQLLRTSEELWNASRLFFARWNLSPSQFNVLNLLRQQPAGRSQVDLSLELIMHRSNVTGLVDRLEKRGLAKRETTPGDRRVYRVVITEEGRRLIDRILPHYYRTSEALWEGISTARTTSLLRDLTQVSVNTRKLADQGTAALDPTTASLNPPERYAP